MLHKLSNVLIKDFLNIKVQPKRFSALFMNGPKATENYVHIIPHVDYTEYFEQRQTVQNELLMRQAKNDLNKLESLWEVYNELKSRKNQLTDKKEIISKELHQKMKDKIEGNEVEKLKIQHNLLKENINKLKGPLWSAEENAIIEYLQLPNKLHSLTPVDKSAILYEQKSPPANNKHHLTIGKENDVLSFTKNENYYLKNDAAIFELGAKFYFSKLLRENDFVQFSNPDFSKSVIVEGCGEDHTNPNSTFILHHNEDGHVNTDNRLHLTGAGSLCSFFAYHAKNVLYGKVLPLKYFSMGRQYVPPTIHDHSLFHVSQSSVVQTFMVAKSAPELDHILNNMIDLIKESYKVFGYHFRVSILPANKLKHWESLRIAIEMYSSSLKNYVEIGNLSVSGDFISKRLMFTYMEGKENKFPHVLSGTILNVPRFLGCVLEQDSTFAVPKQFTVENWSL